MKRHNRLTFLTLIGLFFVMVVLVSGPIGAGQGNDDFNLTASETPVATSEATETGARDGAGDENSVMPEPDPLIMANLYEGFDNINSLPASGWNMQNLSSPIGTISWFQGNPNVFPAHTGATNSYIGVNFNSTAGVGTISNWLLTPILNLNNGDRIRFRTRTVSGNTFPDRLQIRMSLSGSSTNVGSTATSVGVFTNLLLDINPTYSTAGYPQVWTQYELVISGVPNPTNGRIAFRYFVENGGPNGVNSNYIGIDSFVFFEDIQSVYLPVTLRDYCGGFKGPMEAEPNDLSTQANGSICPDRNYFGSPDNHGSGLDSDYFYIDLAGSGTLVVDVTNFLPNRAQVQLYAAPVSAGTLLASVADQSSGNYHIAYPVVAGRYYIRVVAADGHATGNGNYTLRVTGP